MAEPQPNRYLDFVKMYPFHQSRWEGLVAVCFGHAHAGWILFWLSTTVFLQSVTIYTSYTFDPYNDLVEWLENIVKDRLPAECVIDEEGRIKTLWAARAENKQLDLQVLNGFSEEPGAAILFRARVPKRQLVAEFVRKLDLFLQEYYQREQWEYGFDLSQLDLSVLKEYLQNGKS